MIKNLYYIFLLLFVSQTVFAQEHVFIKNEESARYQLKKDGIRILTSEFVLEKDQITQEAMDFIIMLMEEKSGFVSIDFTSRTEVTVKHQENIEEAYILKMLNRKGFIYKKKPLPQFEIPRN